MNECFRLRALSVFISLAICCVLTSDSRLHAAAYPASPTRHPLKNGENPSPGAASATSALFEKDSIKLAASLAQHEIKRTPRNLDAWFVAMEAAALLGNEANELRSASTLCALAKDGDPRVTVAAMRLAELGKNSDLFRQKRTALENLANGESPCGPAAAEALYEASLDGLPDAEIRNWSAKAGWLTKWTIVRAGAAAAKSVPEQFEFADSVIRVPEYLPAASTYIAETSYVASSSGQYVVTSDLGSAKLALDDKELVPGLNTLTAGEHNVRLTFRAVDGTPRIRIYPLGGADQLSSRTLRMSARETTYLHAAVSLAEGDREGASDLIRQSELAGTLVGQRLVAERIPGAVRSETATERPTSCVPGSLACAEWLANNNHDAEAITEIKRVLHDWPLDRAAHRMLISELQRTGNDAAADRAAADFLAIAPNARNFRRMALSASASPEEEYSAPFYARYRRAAPAPLEGTLEASSSSVILLQDKVAIERRDGSVSLYMHRVVQILTTAGIQTFRPLALPEGGQLLSAHLVNQSGTEQPVDRAALRAGDEVEEEFVVNYTGDNGMIAHPEAFQFVFNNFDAPLLDARFVVLSPATDTPAYVIASGNVPPSAIETFHGLRAQIWERKTSVANAAIPDPAIVRVVENENGWSIPPSVERRRILETIHPGPRPREA